MEFIGKEITWLNELNLKSDDLLQQEINSLQAEAYNCELQIFGTKLYLKLKEVSQEKDKLQHEYNSLQRELIIINSR